MKNVSSKVIAHGILAMVLVGLFLGGTSAEAKMTGVQQHYFNFFKAHSITNDFDDTSKPEVFLDPKVDIIENPRYLATINLCSNGNYILRSSTPDKNFRITEINEKGTWKIGRADFFEATLVLSSKGKPDKSWLVSIHNKSLWINRERYIYSYQYRCD
jgi:hypothetical protein